MMVDEVFEIYKNANMLVKAVDSGADFGVGDLTALLIIKKILPKLRAYYLFLSITFLASIVALPYMVPAAVLALAQAVGAMFEFSTSAGTLAPFGVIFLFAATEVVIYVGVTKIKSRIFGFSSSQPLISATSAKARMSVTVETLNHVFEENPEEITY
jgi:hypothetical protein